VPPPGCPLYNNCHDGNIIIVPTYTPNASWELSRIDLTEALAHPDLLFPRQREYLERVRRKTEFYPRQFDYEAYAPHSPLLALCQILQQRSQPLSVICAFAA